MKTVLSFTALWLTTGMVSAADWPQFRGPAAAGVAEEKGLPASWGPRENVRWKAEIPGRSVASPIIAAGRVYVTAAAGVHSDKLSVLCFDAKSGARLWHRQLNATGNTGCHPKSSMAAPTPVANADGVFVLFATADLVALDKDGNLRWYRSLASDYPKIANQVGMASSPILWKNTLLVPMDSDGESFLAGLDVKTGRNLWKVERPKDINWVTPAIRQVGDKAEVLFLSRLGLAAYDPEDGRRLWNYAVEGGTIASPVMMGQQVLMMSRGLMCLQPRGEGTPDVVWTSQKLNSGSCTPLVYKERIYSVNGTGVLVCADKAGKEIWTERLKKGKYWASPIAADDKVFVCSDEGICTVVQAGGDKADILATNELNQEIHAYLGRFMHFQFAVDELKPEIMGTPAIADGAIYVQTVNGLYCIAK